MRICWFDDNKPGLVEGDMVSDVSAALKALPAPQYPASNGDLPIANLDKVRWKSAKVAPGAKGRCRLRPCASLSPVANPSKIIGVPVNYLKHAEEAKEQLHVFTARHQGTIEEAGLFLKSTSSLIGPGEAVKLRFPERRSDHEMEVGVIIGKVADRVSEADALKYVAGYCIAL